MSGWMWIILAVIASVSIGKILYELNHDGNVIAGTYAPGNQRAAPARTSFGYRPEVTETPPMIYYANDRHGRGDKEYRFHYKKVGGSWRAYILRMPSLGNRDSSGVATHRLYDGGRPYVCWDSPVNSLRDMQAVSKVWADHIQEYIATGRRFG